jgi:hypothetical protein
MSEETGATLFARGISVTRFPWENSKPAVISRVITVSHAAKWRSRVVRKRLRSRRATSASRPAAVCASRGPLCVQSGDSLRAPEVGGAAVGDFASRDSGEAQAVPPADADDPLPGAGGGREAKAARAPRAVSVPEKTIANRDHDENRDPREVARTRTTTASPLALVPQQHLTAFGDAEFIRDTIAAFLGQNEAAGAMQMSVRESPSRFAVGTSETDPCDSYFSP